MIEIKIPGYKTLQIEHLVLDYNGTLACDGQLIDGVSEALSRLAGQVSVHVVTADTFGLAGPQLTGLPCDLTILPSGGQAEAKRTFVQACGAGHTASIGNGRNDRLMLQEAALGIAVILGEGAAAETIAAADVVCLDIVSALELLLHPLRLQATLRS